MSCVLAFALLVHGPGEVPRGQRPQEPGCRVGDLARAGGAPQYASRQRALPEYPEGAALQHGLERGGPLDIAF
jgi:hypothetical protein